MNAGRDSDPIPVHELHQSVEPDDPLGPIGPPPTLEDLTPEASGRIVRYIVTVTLERGVAPTAVIALYADLAGDDLAVRYADRRFMLREVPPDWREVENRVVDLEETARERGLDLAAAWRRASGVAMHGQDALEQLARLAGVRNPAAQRQRSIFDDPEDLDTLDDDSVLSPNEEIPMWQLLAHVVNHGTQHRSEVARYLTECGHSPGDLDLLDAFELPWPGAG